MSRDVLQQTAGLVPPSGPPQLHQARKLMAAGRLAQARQACHSGLAQSPRNASLWLLLATVLESEGDMNQAAQAWANAIRSDPRCLEAYLGLGRLLQNARAWDRALVVYTEGRKLFPTAAPLLCDLGAALLSLGQAEAAIEVLEQAVAAAPEDQETLYNLGSALLEQGQFQAAEAQLDALIRLNPRQVEAWFKLVHCRRQVEEDRHRLAPLARLARAPQEEIRARAGFALGKLHDDLGQREQAWQAYEQGNSIRRRQRFNDPEANARFVDDLIASCDRSLFTNANPDRSSGSRQIFIIGLPRCGSTLLDQVLGSHSQLACLGENDRLARAKVQLLGNMPATTVGYPQAIAHLQPGALASMANRIEQRLPTGAARVIDKTLTNDQNIGLIKLLFPAARFIHLQRDPRDAGLSMFFSDFSHGFAYAFDLGHIAAQVRDHDRLMAHWKSLFPDDFLALRYEDLVTNFEATVTKSLQFLGLSPESGMAQFHRRNNAVATASQWQVRQPLYQSSVSRWQRYAERLGPLSDLS